MRSDIHRPVYHAVRQIFTDRPPEFHRAETARIHAAYGQKHRHYHTVTHLQEMLAEAKAHEIDDKRAFLAAILYHDYLYEPHRYAKDFQGPSNENVSAMICVETLVHGGVNPMTALCAGELIRMTESHKAPEGDAEAMLFMDIDMAILGAPHKRYIEYAGGVAREFMSAIPAQDYMTGRMMFLDKIRKTAPIFRTDHFDHVQEQVIKNVEWELVNLPQLMVTAALTNQVAGFQPVYR